MNEVFLCVGCAIGHTCHWTHLRCEGSKGSKGSACLWQAGSKGGGGALRAQIIKKGALSRRGLCRRVVSPQGKRLTMICASLVLLQIMFAVHRFAQGATALRAEGGGLPPLRAMSFISRLRRSRQHRVSILSAYLVHPFPLRGASPQGETRALRDWLSASYSMISILVNGSLRSPPPFPLRGTSPASGSRTKHREIIFS